MSTIPIAQVASSTPFDNETNGFVAEETQAAIEEVKNDAGSARMAVNFGYDGNANNNTWLQTFKGVSSNNSPFVVAEEGTLTSLSVSFRVNSTVTFSVYVNGGVTDTITVTADNRGILAGLSTALVVSDEVAIRITSGSCRDVSFWIKIKTDS